MWHLELLLVGKCRVVPLWQCFNVCLFSPLVIPPLTPTPLWERIREGEISVDQCRLISPLSFPKSFRHTSKSVRYSFPTESQHAKEVSRINGIRRIKCFFLTWLFLKMCFSSTLRIKNREEENFIIIFICYFDRGRRVRLCGTCVHKAGTHGFWTSSSQVIGKLEIWILVVNIVYCLKGKTLWAKVGGERETKHESWWAHTYRQSQHNIQRNLHTHRLSTKAILSFTHTHSHTQHTHKITLTHSSTPFRVAHTAKERKGRKHQVW